MTLFRPSRSNPAKPDRARRARRLAKQARTVQPLDIKGVFGQGESSSGRDQFIAAIGHELRTPLNAIMGFTQLAQSDDEPDRGRSYLEHIEQASRLMLRVVNDLLDLTKLDAGRLEIQPDQPLNVYRLVADALVVASTLRQEKPIKLYAAVDPNCPDMLRGDAGRFEQILLNLLANALKYTDQGQVKLTVRVKALHTESVRLRIAVQDTGLGMPMSALEKLGQPFEQAHLGDASGIVGTGLGLSVVSRLLELHGAQLHVTSVHGGGSLFWLDIEWPIDVSYTSSLKSPDTVVISNDQSFIKTMAVQWRAHGAALRVESAPLVGHRCVVDGSLKGSHGIAKQATAMGCEVIRVNSGPLDTQSDISLAALPAHVFKIRRQMPEQDRACLQGMKALVVEDNPLNQHVLREYLRRLGASVHVVGDGTTALEAMSQRHFDVVLLDIQMPGMNGWQVARAIRSKPHGADIQIIFLSAHVDADDDIQAQALGALACMTKPFDHHALRALLVRINGNDSAQSPSVMSHAPGGLTNGARSRLMDLFSQQWPALKLGLLNAEDGAALRQAVHALRGSLAVLSQPALLQQVRSIEEALLKGRAPDRGEVGRLTQSIDALLLERKG